MAEGQLSTRQGLESENAKASSCVSGHNTTSWGKEAADLDSQTIHSVFFAGSSGIPDEGHLIHMMEREGGRKDIPKESMSALSFFKNIFLLW